MPTEKERFNNRPNYPNPLPKTKAKIGRLPRWLHRPLPKGRAFLETQAILKQNHLNTVCEEAKCPNRLECYSKKTATFLALGKACTRACGFCEIDFSKSPKLPEKEEPEHIARAIQALSLRHVVITMVARDDLADQGANHIAAIITTIRKECKETSVEVLTSDFSGSIQALDTVLEAKPEIFNHNIETVRRLTPRVRHKATYERSLFVLSHAKKQSGVSFVKSGVMVGLGESEEEVKQTIRDLHQVGCEIITIGQYLQPSRKKLLVKSFVTPEQFKRYEIFGHEIGVKHMYSGPLVRSSYNASLLKDKAFARGPS